MKESRTTSIGKIIAEMEEDKRKELITLVERALKETGCSEVKWQDFEVYIHSVEIMKQVLCTLSVEFIMAVCELVLQEEAKRTVKISFILTKNESEISTINVNFDTKLVYIYLSEKRANYLSKCFTTK